MTIALLLATLASSSAWAIHFYRSPQSLFPSGEVSLSRLTKSPDSATTTFDYLIESEGKSFWLNASELATDLDLSQSFTMEHEEYSLMERRGSWLAVKRKSDGRTAWAPYSQLRPSNTDPGMALTLVTTAMRKGPSWTSDLVVQVPPKTYLPILSIQDSWLKVSYESGEGFIDLNNVLMKADFATSVTDDVGRSYHVKYREGFSLIVDRNEILPIERVRLWQTEPTRGIMLANMDDKGLSLRQNIRIKKVHAEAWRSSELPGHGQVFWRPSEAIEKNFQEEPISVDEILKDEVYSVNFSSKDSNVGLLSAKGIYSTTDGGVTWSLLKQFQGQNYPVSIGPDGCWYVGFFRSKNSGRDFHEYVRTDFLTKMIQSEFNGRPPKFMRVSDIGFNSKNSLEIHIDTGLRSMLLQSTSREDVITDWRVSTR